MKAILNEWKKFLAEHGEILPAVEDEPQELPLPESGVPGELYYVLPRKFLWNVAKEGILDFKEPQHGTEEISRQEGILFYNDFNEAVRAAAPTAQVVVVFDGTGLSSEGQYEFYPTVSEASGVFKTKAIMRDSAIDSGNGSSELVDELGTWIPFRYAKGVFFGQKITPTEAQSLSDRGLGDIHVGSYATPTPE